MPGIAAIALAGSPASAIARCEPAGNPIPGQTASAAADLAPGTPDPRELPGSPDAADAGHGGTGPQVGDPPWPRPPEVVVRDEQGRVTVRAVRLAAGLQLDGVLDEPLYDCVRAIGNFIQLMPDEGAPATERTEAWIAFDTENIYISARVWDSAPPADWVANEMRRDTTQLRDNDGFWVVLDTFHDRRNGLGFYTNPLGALGDFEISNEGNPNSDWNPVWDVDTGRFDGGWTVEMEIPFKSLRYRPGADQVWGVQLRRTIRRKNEVVFLTPLPISAGLAGIFRVSQAATLVGLEVPAGVSRLEIKPYGIGGLTTDLAATPPRRNAGEGSGGLDVKYGLTQNLTADLTYNTDFAQVEVDEQQVNLTRFSLFFPEKREFFLEAQGIFNFARGAADNNLQATGLRQIGGGDRRAQGPGNAPTLFYSRRIGLEGGAVVPIVGGGRVTGKVGDFDVGALNIQTGDEQTSGAVPTNFTVLRLRRDILRRSSIGALLTNRSVSINGDGSNQAYGADATFSFYDNVNILGYVARTRTPGLDGDDLSYQGQFVYTADRYGLQAEHLVVEENFVPEVGFLRRDNFRRSYATARFSPRPSSLETIRQFRLEGSFDYILTADTGYVETRQTQVAFLTEFESSDRLGVSAANNYELLVEPFEAGPDVTLPVGGYGFRDVELLYEPGTQRRFSGELKVRLGEYFNGSIRSVTFSRGRLEVTPQLSVEPTISVNWIDTPHGAFRADLAVSRVTYTFTPRMFFSGLVQYNSSTNTVGNNLRLRWEYTPGSELFVVYTDERFADPFRPDRSYGLRSRGLMVKVNRLFRL